MKLCVVCDTMGCCDSREQHTYEEGCILDRNTPAAKMIAELERVLEAVKVLRFRPQDKAARACIIERTTEDGQLVIGNRDLLAAMME